MRYAITGRESGRRMRSSLIRSRYNSDWYACRRPSFETDNCVWEGKSLTYLEILLQLDNIFIFQPIADFLANHVLALSLIGKVNRFEQLQERPCNSDVIAEAHSSAQRSVY
jgi:hypothetical protein